MKRIACLIAALALALTGCDTFNQMIGIVGADYRPPLKTGAIKGKVVDRNGNPLVGAKVSNGAAVYFTADDGGSVRDDLYDSTASEADRTKHTMALSKGEFVLTKVAGNNINYVVAEFDGQTSPAVQVYVNAGTFDVSKEAGKQGITFIAPSQNNEVKIAIDEPVAADSKLISFVSTNIADNIVTAASASATIQYDHSKVSIFVKAPPGGQGVTIKSSRVVYQNSNGVALGSGEIGTNNDIPRTLPAPVTVLPGTNTSSGQLAQIDVPISNVNESFITTLRNARELKIQVKLYTDTGAQDVVKDRATGEDLIVLLTLKYQQ